MDLLREDLKIGGRIPRVPSRVVMNNRTLTVFENDQYESALFSVILRDMKVMDYLKDKEDCLVVIDNKQEKRVVLCGLDDKQKEKEEWVKEIKFFRDYCFHDLQPGKGKLGQSGNTDDISAKSDEDLIKDDPLLNIKNREMQEELAFKR